MRRAGASVGLGFGVSPQPVHRLAAKCGLTLRSSGHHRHGAWPARLCRASSASRAKHHAGGVRSAQTLGSTEYQRTRFASPLASHACKPQCNVLQGSLVIPRRTGSQAMSMVPPVFEQAFAGASWRCNQAPRLDAPHIQSHEPRCGGTSAFCRCSMVRSPITGRDWGACAPAMHWQASSFTPTVKLQRRAKKCCLTLRSSGPPPASRLAREPASVIIHLAGQAPFRRGPLSSNVRPHVNTSKAFVVTAASVRSTAECKSLERSKLAGQSIQNRGFRRGAATFYAKFQSGGAPRLHRPRIEPTLNGQFVEPPDGGGTPCIRSALAGQFHRTSGHARGWSIGGARLLRVPVACASFGSRVRSNPSLERTSTGLALGPRGYSGHHPPRGPSANPVVSAQLKR